MVNRRVVGVDGSSGSQAAALDFGVAETALRAGSVQALHSWQRPIVYSERGWVTPLAEYEGDARRVLDEAIATAAGSDDSGRAPPPVVAELQQGHPAERLLAAAESADLLVVGSRGRGGFVGPLLGSVTPHRVTHARCPVVVVREPGTPRGGVSS